MSPSRTAARLLGATALSATALAFSFGPALAADEAVATAMRAPSNVDPRDEKIAELMVRLDRLAGEVEELKAKGAAAPAAGGAPVTVNWKGAPEFSGPDKSTFKARGRALVDGVFQTWEPENSLVSPGLDTREFRGRQMFLGVEGRITSNLYYKIEGGWVNGGTPGWDDAYLEYRPNANTSLIFGNAKATGLENVTSTRFLTFMERGPYANVAGLDYNMGIIARHWGKNWSATVAVQGDSLNSSDVFGEETLSGTARLTFAPINDADRTIHVGAWGRLRDHGTGSGLGYTPRPSTAFIPGGAYALRGTGGVGDSDTTLGAEGLAIFGPFSVQGEYVRVSYEGLDLNPDSDIDAGYVEGSFFIGGKRTYSASTGDIGRPKMGKGLGQGGWGALQLAARYDFANIDGSPLAGDYDGWSLGANYYVSPYMRFMANYIDGSQSNPLTLDDIDVRVFQIRAQIDF